MLFSFLVRWKVRCMGNRAQFNSCSFLEKTPFFRSAHFADKMLNALYITNQTIPLNSLGEGCKFFAPMKSIDISYLISGPITYDRKILIADLWTRYIHPHLSIFGTEISVGPILLKRLETMRCRQHINKFRVLKQ
jgi:hypothetical protein